MNPVSRRTFLSAAGGLVAAAAVIGKSEDAIPPADPSTKPTAVSDISMEDVDPRPPELATTRPGERPRFNYRRVRPKEFKGDLLNPHIGTQTFQRFNGDSTAVRIDDAHGPVKFPPYAGNPKNEKYPDTTVSYCRWVWSVLEPQKGNYQWQILDGAIKSAEDRGQTLHVRLQPFVLRNGNMPDWYWALAGTDFQNEPDANNPAYIENFGNLIRAFGKKYDGHKTLEAFDIAYAGEFGEMGGSASPETSAALTDIYCDALPKTQLVAMMGTYGCIYAMKLKRPIGFRFDCYGDMRSSDRRRGPATQPATQPAGPASPELVWNEMMDAYPRQLEQAHAWDQWKIAPVTLETCGTVASWYRGKYDIDWIIEQGYKYHPTFFMNKSGQIPDEWWDKIIAFNRRLGYRFVLRQFDLPQKAAAGESIRLSVWIDNVGVAPIYRPYRLAIRYTQGDTKVIVPFAADIRKWTPDNHWVVEHIAVPKQLQPGVAQIDMGIINDANEAKVKLSIEGVGADGWHPMCPFTVV